MPELFVPDTPAWEAPLTDPALLGAVAADTLRYIRESGETTAEGVEDTLSLVVTAGDSVRDPAWLGRCMQALRWNPDSQRWNGRIRLTRYVVWQVEGSAEPSAAHPWALYALPDDELGLTVAEAEARRDTLLRYRYMRQDVSGGVYRAGGEAEGRARPLVWLAPEDHEQALLQGTTSVRLPDGQQLYNVDRNNGIPWDRTGNPVQRRYWYFREVDVVRGHGVAPITKIRLEPMVAVAGDLANVGLGRLIALRTADGLRLVVLADTGGAFQPNLHQLDLYSGIFPSASAFHEATRAVGDTAGAWVLVRKEGVEGC